MAKMLPIIKNNIPFVMDNLGRNDLAKKDIHAKYLELSNVTCESEFDPKQDKYGRYVFGMLFATAFSQMKKAGSISSPKRSVYTLEDESLIPPSFTQHTTNGAAPTPTPQEIEVEGTPTPQEVEVETTPTQEVEVEATPTQEVEATPTQEVEAMVEVSVKNPAVIEAHIDTTTNELVENVGGSKDYRKPLEEVEDGYITSNVEITTTTLDASPVVELEDSSNELEDEPQETFESSPVVEATQEVEEAVQSDLEDLFDELEEAPQVVSYDLKVLRNDFDPHVLPLRLPDNTEVKGDFLVYRDKENRNLVITQKGREDYLVVPVDVEHDRQDFTKYGEIARKEFDEALNHKQGSGIVVRALTACKTRCQHTDDFAGFVEECANPNCPVFIWKGGTTYVNPTNS